MNDDASTQMLSITQRFILLFVALGLGTVLFFLKGDIGKQNSLEEIASRSLPPEVALRNGKPTVFEFYADWCEVCKKMAPSMLSLEDKNSGKVDFVFLNVENDRWYDLIDTYKVKGIPQLNFFDKDGELFGTSVGLRTLPELDEVLDALVKNKSMPDLAGINAYDITSLTDYNKSQEQFITPRSHG